MNTYAEKKKAAMPSKQAHSALKNSDEQLRSGLASLHSRPTALSGELGAKIRERCGIDPSAVKVFRDDGLGDLGQKAYAKGSEIHLASGVSTSGEAGERVILHEAAHIAQQGNRSVTGLVNDNPDLEQQADRVAAGEVMQGNASVPMNSESAPIQGWAPWDKAKKKFADWKQKDAEATDYFARGGFTGNKHLDRLITANDWVRDKMDDFKDWRGDVKDKIAKKYHGSALESGVNATKSAFSTAGHWVGDKAKAAGGWVSDKATAAGNAIKGSKLGQWVSQKKEERAKKKAEEALKPKEPGKVSQFLSSAKNWAGDKAKAAGSWVSDKATSAGNAIKGSKLGQWVSKKKEEHAKKKAAKALEEPGWFKKKAMAAGEKIKSGAGWVKDKAVGLGKWGMQTKEDVTNWIQDKKQAYADHEDQRYMKRLVRKGGAETFKNIIMADHDFKHGEYSDNVKHRAEALQDYDEEKRSFMTDEESQAANAAKAAEPMSAGKIFNMVRDNVEPVGAAMSAHEARKRGNAQQAALDSMAVMGKGVQYLTKAGKKLEIPGTSTVSSAVNMGINIGGLGIHGYQKHKLNGVDDAAAAAGVDAADKKYMRIARKGYGEELDENLRSDVGNIAKDAISLAGSGLGAVTGGASSKAAKYLNKGITKGVEMMNSSSRAKADRQIGYEDIFGSVDAAKAFKHSHGIDRSTMEILMKRNTGSRTMGDLANRSRYEAARVNHQYLARDGANGAKSMMAAFGEKNYGQTPLSMIEEKMGQTQTLAEMNKRRRKAF